MATIDVFPKRLTDLREKKGLKRQQVADDLGITRASLEFYEKGKRKPDIEMTAKIAKYFQVSADYLLGLSNTPTTDEDLKFICDYTGLSDTVINSLFHNKNNKPYNLSHILNSIGADKDGIIKLSFFISHIVEYEVAAKHYYSLAECSEREKDEQLLESIELQADARKDIMELKEFKLSKEFFEILNVLVKNGDIDNGNNTQEE